MPVSDPLLKGFPAFVRRVLADWKVPGAAIAVVRDGETILCDGFGLQTVKRELPVTPRTIFPIASVTKAFTTMLLGMLADEGRLDWDAPVREYLPDFALQDPLASRRATPRDLVSHRTGLPRHDNMWDFCTLDRAGIFERLRHLEPSRAFRTAYQYNNLMFMTAGVLIERITGKSWEDNVRERLFAPLGMTQSSPTLPPVRGLPELATPYAERRGKAVAIPAKDFTPCGPAGTICSSVADMVHWLEFHLDGGKVGRKRLISAGNLAEMHAPQTIVPGPSAWPEIPMQTYGLGWMCSVYRGHRRIQHGGAIDGFATLVSFLPEQRFGVVVLTNKHRHPVPHIIELSLCDRLLGERTNWNGRMRKQWNDAKKKSEEQRKKRAREKKRNAPPSHALGDYAGTYAHAGYGEAGIAHQGRGLSITIGGFSAPLTHYHYDTFHFQEEVWDNGYLSTFNTDTRGRIASVSIPLEPSVPPVIFTRTEEDTKR